MFLVHIVHVVAGHLVDLIYVYMYLEYIWNVVCEQHESKPLIFSYCVLCFAEC